MDFQRTLLWAALAMVLMLIWQAWQKENALPNTAAISSTASPGMDASRPNRAELPATPAAANERPDVQAIQSLPSAKRINIRTDVFDIEIDTAGGDIRQAKLLEYPVSVEEPNNPFRLMGEGNDTFIAQSGLISASAEDSKVPDHRAIYQAQKDSYQLSDSEENLEVKLRWQEGDITVNKIYRFKRGSYVVDIRYEVENAGSSAWQGYLYRQLQRQEVVQKGMSMLPTYTGGVISGFDTQKGEAMPYEKIDFGDMAEKNLALDIKGGWTAMIQHYFLAALIPASQEDNNRLYSKSLGEGRYVLGMISQSQTVAATDKTNFDYKMFIGPKIQEKLKEAAPNLQLTVDFGFVTIIAEPLFWLLDKLHGLFGNWGWAIIALTVLIKAAFYKLQAKGLESMAHMRKMTPRIQTLKERYADDRQKLNQEMMALWRKEKINPMGGCLPILIQMPVFLALYWVLLESVELRQAEWILWYKDLSIMDPYYILPLLMGITMLIQFKLNPTPADPLQAKMMMIMPIVFTVLFVFFPAGLVLYWTVNNTLQILQQWMITRRIEAQG